MTIHSEQEEIVIYVSAGFATAPNFLDAFAAELAARFEQAGSRVQVVIHYPYGDWTRYCMPADGLDWLPGAEVLTDDEIVRLITIGVERLGITTVRLTGGEPLLRKNLELLVANIAALTRSPEIRSDDKRDWPGPARGEAGHGGPAQDQHLAGHS